MTRIFAFLFFGFLALALGWTLAGFWPVGLILLILTPLSLYLVKRKVQSALSLALALIVLTAAVGLWRGLNLSLALMAILSALAAWDLDGFSHRLALVPAEDHPNLVERQHWFWLALVLFLGAGFSFLAQSLRFEASFERAALLALLTFGGLGALLNWLKNRES